METNKTKTMEPLILDETDPLEDVLVWGEPGIEALLGQLLPQSRSLFRSYYEVPKARAEFARMQSQLEAEGVRVLRAKDAVAELLKNRDVPELPASIHDLKLALHHQADAHFGFYRPLKQDDLQNDGLINITPEDIYREVKRDIDLILEEDMEAYGEQGALRLNYVLSLSKAWPMANIFYGRDQSQVIADRAILSSLRWNIRKPEVRIYRDALIEAGFAPDLITPREGTLEGGDIAMYNGYCFIGVGARTSMSAVLDIYRQIGAELEKRNIKLIAVANKRQEEESHFFISPTSEHMQVMHLDMFWSALSPNLVMGYPPEMTIRRALWVTQDGGKVVVKDLGDFQEFLQGMGVEILEVTAEEQRNFATNFLNLGHNRIIAALSSNPRVNEELQKHGFKIIYAELNKLVDGYGAVHCLTAPLRRTPRL